MAKQAKSSDPSVGGVYVPCPGNGVTHAMLVFCEKIRAKKGFWAQCNLCMTRMFLNGPPWIRGGLRRGDLPPGALDGYGRPL